MRVKQELQHIEEYRSILQQAQQAESNLREYVQAIEEFELESCGVDQSPIRCRNGLLTPRQILRCAGQEADRLEQLTNQAILLRRRLLTCILQQSEDLQEYRALYKLYIDNIDDAV